MRNFVSFIPIFTSTLIKLDLLIKIKIYFQDDVTRFWREEKEKGAIYNVYLKKVTYHTLSDVSTWLRSYYFCKIRCTEKSEKEVKSRSVSKTTSVKKIRNLCCLQWNWGYSYWERKNSKNEKKKRIECLLPPVGWVGERERERILMTLNVKFALVFVYVLFFVFLNSTLKVLEAIVEFDRFCHSKEEPHLLNSYGEGISTDGEALLLGCFETKKYFAIETRLILCTLNL